jgi:hypothetical protein
MIAQQGALVQTLVALLEHGQEARTAREEASADLLERTGRALVEAIAAKAAAEAQVQMLTAPEGTAPSHRPTPTRPTPEGVLGRALRWAERH